MLNKVIFSLLVIFGLLLLSCQAEAKSLTHEREIACLAQMIYYEAKGESKKGKAAVSHVTLNRVEHKKFPNTICGVISQRGQYQWYHNKRLRKGRVFNKHSNPEIYKIAKLHYLQHVMGTRRDNTRGALFFSSNGVNPHKRSRKLITIGGHAFYGF